MMGTSHTLFLAPYSAHVHSLQVEITNHFIEASLRFQNLNLDTRFFISCNWTLLHFNKHRNFFNDLLR